VHTAIASSSHHYAEFLRSAGLTALFDVRVDGTDLDRLGLSGKPAPDKFLEAARRLGAPPLGVVVFEDATPGIAAARAGGCLGRPVALRRIAPEIISVVCYSKGRAQRIHQAHCRDRA
jgi:HAD superfamily hydrolase (TIGR01509 family)